MKINELRTFIRLIIEDIGHDTIRLKAAKPISDPTPNIDVIEPSLNSQGTGDNSDNDEDVWQMMKDPIKREKMKNWAWWPWLQKKDSERRQKELQDTIKTADSKDFFKDYPPLQTKNESKNYINESNDDEKKYKMMKKLFKKDLIKIKKFVENDEIDIAIKLIVNLYNKF